MKIKTFQIRLAEPFVQADQEHVNNFLSEVTVKKTAAGLVADQHWSLLAFYTDEKPLPTAKNGKAVFPVETELNEEEKRVYETLKQWRFDKALALGVAAYIITSNSELITIAKVRPQSVEELVQIRGFGPHKIAKYGEDIIAVLNSVG